MTKKRLNKPIYPQMRYHGKKMPVHRAIMAELFGSPLLSRWFVHHKNGNTFDNRIENLEILTREEHNKLHNTGERHPQSKLTLEQVKSIKLLCALGVRTGQIAAMYKMPDNTISCIKTGVSWKQVEILKDYNPYEYRRC